MEISLKEMCELTGISRRTIQGYEKAELVSAIKRNKYGHLIYDNKCKERILKIKFMQDLKFSLKEIKEIIDAPNYVLKKALIQNVSLLKEDQQHLNSSKAFVLAGTSVFLSVTLFIDLPPIYFTHSLMKLWPHLPAEISAEAVLKNYLLSIPEKIYN